MIALSQTSYTGDIIVRRVAVDGSRTPCSAIAATKRVQYVNNAIADAMPRAQSDEVEIVFFAVDRTISDAELEQEYEQRGLIPADPFSLAAVNEADPAFADTYPNATHWKDAEGCWCFAAFSHWLGIRVDVYRYGHDWSGYWWFAGRRK